eukprot:scaffold85845_cov45-Phaeocystis_antarctica.AAC.1
MLAQRICRLDASAAIDARAYSCARVLCTRRVELSFCARRGPVGAMPGGILCLRTLSLEHACEANVAVHGLLDLGCGKQHRPGASWRLKLRGMGAVIADCGCDGAVA